MALLCALALPGARRFLSTAGCHHLERRLDLIVKGTWVTTGLVLGSGTYLTLTQTAYDAPFSTAEVDAVFALPYGKPYFLSPGGEDRSLPPHGGGRRPARAGGEAADALQCSAPRSSLAGARPGPADARGGGGVATAVRAVPPRVAERGVGPASLSATVVLAGGVGIAVCVTILKYLHELIESARGLL